MSFACPACDIVLWDGVDYAWCPACGAHVDWVDLRVPLWCCPGCDAFVNAVRDTTPGCGPCDRPMAPVHVHERPASPDAAPARGFPVAAGLFGVVGLALLAVLALDRVGRIAVVPILLAGVVGALGLVVAVVASFGELRAFARDRTNRVIHGLEHATIKLLLGDGRAALGGLTHDGFFEVTIANDGRASITAVRTAVRRAIKRIRAGEDGLAYDPRCGTSRLVALTVSAVIILAGTLIGVLADVDGGVIAASTIAAAAIGWLASRPLGLAAQRAWTVSTRFRRARIARITRTITGDGAGAIFLVHLVIDTRPRRRGSARRATSTGEPSRSRSDRTTPPSWSTRSWCRYPGRSGPSAARTRAAG